MLQAGLFSSRLYLELFKPAPGCFNVEIRQTVSCIREISCDLCARFAKKVDDSLSLGSRNDWILVPCTDPNAHRRKIGQFVRNQRYHRAKQDRRGQYFWAEQQQTRAYVRAVRIADGNDVIVDESIMLSSCRDKVRQFVRAPF